jgi:hypothetical protein
MGDKQNTICALCHLELTLSKIPLTAYGQKEGNLKEIGLLINFGPTGIEVKRKYRQTHQVI